MSLLTPADRIFVAGHRGMAGAAILRALQRAGHGDPAAGGALLTADRNRLDLLDGGAVDAWFSEHKPSVVVLAAAKVGGSMPMPPIRPISCSRTSESRPM